MASDGKEKFGFPVKASLNYKPSRSSSSASWQSAVGNAGMTTQHSPLGVPASSESLSNSFFSLNWEPAIDHCIPFQSSLGSIVSSSPPSTSLQSDGIVIRELAGRFGGTMCSTGGVSAPSPALGSTMDTILSMSTAWNPLNPSTNLNLTVDPSAGPLVIQNGTLNPPHSLAQFTSDPGFAERAARFSCFGNQSYSELASPFTFTEREPSYRSAHTDNSKMSRVPSNQSLKTGFPMSISNTAEAKETTASEGLQDGSEADPRVTDKKISRLSRSSTPVSMDDMRHRLGASGNESDDAEFSTGREESTSSDQITGGELGSKSMNEIHGRKRKALPKAKANDVPSAVASPGGRDTMSLGADESQAKRHNGGSKEKDDLKSRVQQSISANTGEGSPTQTKENVKLPEQPKQDYIHVRARRGQATDSHSLAERVRREKISERMKFLQDLVPGCSKVTGKAVMLDEIINYVQSLQRQVEFLSMKLATVNPRLDFDMEGRLAKDMLQSHGTSPRMLFTPDSGVAFSQLHQPHQGPMQVNVTCGTEGHPMENPVEAALRRTMNGQPACLDGCGDAISQIANIWDDELQSIVQMGFGQNRQTPFASQGFHGSLPTSHMKVEL